eukprot:scaffold151563_cov45-Attheya_sp.AAC.2
MVATSKTVDDVDIMVEADDDSSKSLFYPKIVSGSIGAIVTSLAVTPLEVVKVRQQVSSSNNVSHTMTQCSRGCGTFVLNNGLMECLLPKSAVPYFDPRSGKATLPESCFSRYSSGIRNNHQTSNRINASTNRGTFDVMGRIFRKEGLAGIYTGLAPTLVMSVPNTVLYFTSYDEIVHRLRKRGGTSDVFWNTVAVPLLGGASARALASLVTSPLELIRTRQASLMGNNSKIQPNSWWKELKDLIRTGGVKSLYRGVVPTLWRDVPFSAIYWLGVEQFRSRLQNSPMVGGHHYLDRGELIPPWLEASHAFMSGAAAGMIAAAMTTPFDVVKTRQQMVQTSSTSSSSSQATTTTTTVPSANNMATTSACHHNGAIAYNQHAEGVARRAGTLTHLKHIYNVEGVQGLWRGNQTRMIKVAPGCAIMISCYQFGKRILE